MTNKSVFAFNLKAQMEMHHKSRREVCKDLGLSYYTFSDWINGKKYPRMDKVELLARYFGISKSDLIEEQKEPAAITSSELIDLISNASLSEKKRAFIMRILSIPDEQFDVLIQTASEIGE